MIEKSNQNEDLRSRALYSKCLFYRYSLTRVWNDVGKKMHFVMLNPSTATEMQNDPTVERCQRRANALGFGAFCVTNIFAWRETEPKKMCIVNDPIGPDNDATIIKGCLWADVTIAAWGNHGSHLKRGEKVKLLLASIGKPIFHLGLSKAGQPKHPLYISYSQQPERWNI